MTIRNNPKQLSGRKIFVYIMIMLSGAMAMTQTPSGFQPHTKASLVTMVLNAPVSVEQIQEYTRKLPNVRSQKEVTTSHIYLDTAGRMRLEMNLSSPLGESVLVVTLADPVAGWIVLLDTPSKIAHRMMLPKTTPPAGFAFAWPGISMAVKNRIVENLGKRTVGAIEYEGTRTKVTSDDQPPLTSVDERWVSTELGLTALVEADSPSEHYSARIQNLIRKNPDPGLFVIPPDYTIRDTKDSD